jgi:hypothetical protein
VATLSEQRPEIPDGKDLKLPRTPLLAIALYVMLALAAAGSLIAGTSPEHLPAGLRLGAPIAFAGFLLLFAIYRFALVRARRFPAGKAFFQVGAGALFLTLLLPGTTQQLRAEPRGIEELMVDRDAAVRALACEVVRTRGDGRLHAQALVERLEDRDPEVRRQAWYSLQSLAGTDFGGPGPGAVERWQKWASGAAAPAGKE